MDPMYTFAATVVLLLGLVYFLSLLFRGASSSSSGSKKTRKAAASPGASVDRFYSGVAKEEDSDSDDGEDADEDEADFNDAHSMRWNSFVNARLQNLAGKDASKLPGIGKASAKKFASAGLPTAYDVLGTYLKRGSVEFQTLCKQIKLRQQDTNSLVSALETRWNSLCLIGSDIEDLKKSQSPEGEHSARWGTFVNCKLSQATLADLPGIGDAFRSKLVKAGFNTPQQLLGEFIIRGTNGFHDFMEGLGIRNVGANANLNEVVSAFEAKWNSLSLQGSA